MIEHTTVADFERMSNDIAPDALHRQAKQARERSPEETTFLSHSSKDGHLMPIVVHILENHGATVYLDDMDPDLLSMPGREVAKLLRSRVRLCRKFILFASNNVRNSRWAPWELSLSDGYKNAQNTAIFPSVDKASEIYWTTQEYLKAYDRIVLGDLQGYSNRLWMVLNQDANTAISLKGWLSR